MQKMANQRVHRYEVVKKSGKERWTTRANEGVTEIDETGRGESEGKGKSRGVCACVCLRNAPSGDRSSNSHWPILSKREDEPNRLNMQQKKKEKSKCERKGERERERKSGRDGQRGVEGVREEEE